MTTATTTKAKTAKAAAKPAAAEAPAAEAPAAAAPAAVEQVLKASQEAAAKGYEQALAATQEQVEKAQAQAAKSTEEALAAAKENLDAVVKAGQLLSSGLQDLSKSVLVLTQEVVEENIASAKKLLTAKSLHEAVDLHSAHAKAQLDRMLSEGVRLTDSTRKVFEEALAPVQAQVQAAVEKLTKLTRH
jgi:phasin family protein